MASPKADVYQAAERIRDALTRLGYCYRTRRGDLIEVSYRALGVVQDRYGILEVDVQRLPPRVSIDRLTADSTLHHLTAVVGRPVRKLNTTGLTYCIELVPAVARRLPRRAHLDLATRPLGEFMVPIGQGMDRAEWRSLLDTSHILVGGESRSGKSTWLNAVLLALLTTCPPTVLRLGVIDPKGVEFTAYGGLPHLVRPIATTPQAASSLSGWLMAEMDRRRDLFASVLARDLQGYNRRACAAGSAPLPLMLVIIDEVSDIAMQCGLKSEFYKNLIRLSSKGAAFGLVLILATQNPKAEVLNTLIRGNMSTRIAFRVASIEHSRTILGCGGAQELPRTVRGRLLARLDESLTELQGYYVPDEEVLALVRHWATQDGPRLTPLEQELVRYARHELGGSFPIGRLYQRFRGTISHRQLVKLARRWASMGWLSPQSSVVAARQLTDRVIEIAQRSADQPGPPDTGCQDMGQGDQGTGVGYPPALHPASGSLPLVAAPGHHGHRQDRRTPLALDVYFREDILNVLRATYAAADGPAALLSELIRDPELRHVPLDRLVQVYRQGFCTALGAVGLAFGLDPSERHSSSPGHLFATPGASEPLRTVAPVGRAQVPSSQSDPPALLWLGVRPDHERG